MNVITTEKMTRKKATVGLLIFSTSAMLCIALFVPAAKYLFAQWSKDDFNYCYIIPFVVSYLILEKKKEFFEVPFAPTWKGFVPLCLGISLYWLGELGGEFYTLNLAFWFMIMGLLFLSCGWLKLKVILFPLLFALVMFPPPNLIYNNLTLKLKLLSSQIGMQMLQLLGMAAYREGNIIDLGFSKLQVVDACSGLRYLFPLLMLSILIAYYYCGAWWKRCLIVVSAIPLTVLTNSLRIASVGFLQPVFGPMVAEGFFHDFSGWVVFMLSLILLLFETLLLRRIFSEPKGKIKNGIITSPKELPSHTPPLQVNVYQQSIAVVLLATTFLVGHGVNFREKFPLAKPFVEFPGSLGEWHGSRQSMEEQTLISLNLTDYLLTDYRNPQGEVVSMYVTYNDSQRKGQSAHSPGSCLPGNGWVFNESAKIHLTGSQMDTAGLVVNRAVIQRSGERMLMYYWFPQRGRVLTNLVELKFYAFWDAITRHRTDGGMVRLITPIYEVEQTAIAEARLTTFARLIVPVLRDYIPD